MSSGQATVSQPRSSQRKTRAPAGKPAVATPRVPRRSAAEDYKLIDEKLHELRMKGDALDKVIADLLKRVG